jgi:hypothetical protein
VAVGRAAPVSVQPAGLTALIQLGALAANEELLVESGTILRFNHDERHQRLIFRPRFPTTFLIQGFKSWASLGQMSDGFVPLFNAV